VRRADLTTFMCRLSRSSGASTSRNPRGLSRPVAGKLYIVGLLPDELSDLNEVVILIILESRNCKLE
jgi:hypothetical protein